MKVKITGKLSNDCTYLTVGREYTVIRSSGSRGIVWIKDDDYYPIVICTEKSSNVCAHMGPYAKAVFV